MFLMLSWRSYQRCGQTMWSGWRFPLSSLHGRDTGWICNISWRGVTLTGSRYCCGPATLRIFSGGSECIVSSGQLQGVIIRSLVKPPSSTHGHFCHNFSRSNLGHFVEKIVFIATVHYLGADIWTWLWAAGAWISSHRTECLRRLCAGRNLRTKGKKPIKNI